MKTAVRIGLRCATVALALALVFGAGGAALGQTTGPDAVTIPVKLTERVSSANAKAGQRFAFATTREVTIGDADVPAGTPGHGIVSEAKAARWDRAGKLSLEVQTIDLSDGRTIAVAAARAPSAEKRGAPKMPSLGSEIVALPLPVHGIVLLGSAVELLRGRDVIFEPGTTFFVVPAVPSSAPLSEH
jgi:hypothetical protein